MYIEREREREGETEREREREGETEREREREGERDTCGTSQSRNSTEDPQLPEDLATIGHFTSQDFGVVLRSFCVNSSSPRISVILRNTCW